MIIKLSKRLAALASMVPKGSVAADIGTDHGYLPAFLILQGISPYAVAGDAAEQPLEAAKHLVELLALERKIDLRLGDGFSILKAGEVDTACIAGMGASTMIKIMEQSPETTKVLHRLVLQPMKGASLLRRWLSDNGWKIIDEQIVFEEGIFYEIIGAEHGESRLSDLEIEVGPVLLKEKHELLENYLRDKIVLLERIYNSMGQGSSPDLKEKQDELLKRIRMMKKVIGCLRS